MEINETVFISLVNILSCIRFDTSGYPFTHTHNFILLQQELVQEEDIFIVATQW